ncbi:hypothetical protein HOLleu_26899 [Holothuria leucospilota]|uniref:Uncharacterized protein n=1 Tax=Holothuria leucospilota TaxID=206669 RepID=A0A9Q1H1X0_HOLLE|nr:hypothetical protein HOLleu_26899 [Holothuria leucospilota]
MKSFAAVCLCALVCAGLFHSGASQARKKILRIGKKSFPNQDILPSSLTQQRLEEDKSLLKMIILSRLSQIYDDDAFVESPEFPSRRDFSLY